MKKSLCSGRDLQSLLDSIKSAGALELQLQLLKELEEIALNDKSAINSVIEFLTILWDDLTCLDVSQCTLNKAILHVASVYFESDVSECLVHFLVLGIKANIWCRKHLQMTLMSTDDDSQEEEHSIFFYQLVLDLLCYSAATYSALARHLIPANKELMLNLENFISEQLNLMKDLVSSEIKKIHTLNSELLKGVQAALDAVARLCRVYCDGIDWDIYHAKTEVEKRDCKEAEPGDHVVAVISCTVEKLRELGVIAANGGGSFVGLLNTSWKGVVSLLQLGKGVFAVKVDITRIIMTLISLATESLRFAAETWSSLIIAKVSEQEAKIIFLPAKFYLIHAVRIISQYHSQALIVYKEIALCVIVIITFRISLGKLEHLNSASEVLAEILEPSSLHLLNSLLNSAQVKRENKLQILDLLFCNRSATISDAEEKGSYYSLDSLNAIFSVTCNDMNKEKMFSLGRFTLFLNLLKGASDLDDDVRLGIARKLGWLLDTLVEEDVYSTILVLKTPIVPDSSLNQQPTFHNMFVDILHAIKTFIITVSSSSAWDEVETFLIENIFHPHFLCWEIVTELWCFILRHADTNMVNDIIDKLCALLTLTSAESAPFPGGAARKTAKLICLLVSYGPQTVVDRVYNSLLDCGRSQFPSSVLTLLLMEGFPVDLLSENTRSTAKKRILTQYFDFIETFEDKSSRQLNSEIYGAPVFALCAALQSLQVSLPDNDMKTLKFLMEIIRRYKSSTNTAIRDKYRKLLGEFLTIISNMKHFYSFDEMEGVILELNNLFIAKPSSQTDSQLFLCKPNLSSFMASLGHLKLSDGEDSARTLAMEELYHMLLRERHWALIHLGITAFGYFAERTSCNELWRFVPEDAALSFDSESGNEADKGTFMSELKMFLEKERAYEITQSNLDQIDDLVKEAQMLKEIAQRKVIIDIETTECDIMEIDDEKQPNKKRKFPDGICKGVEMLQSGLKIMVDVFSEWKNNENDSIEDHDKFMTHFSRLEDVIENLTSLADSG